MNRINKFFLRDVRCFADENEFEIRPITLLVGENSTGKSTVLGCFQALSTSLGYGRSRFGSGIDFNAEPYQMGTFYDIVKRSNPKKKVFELGLGYETEDQQLQIFVTFKEEATRSEPVISQIQWKFESGQIALLPSEEKTRRTKRDEIDVREESDNQFVVGWSRGIFSGGLPGNPYFLLRLLRNAHSDREPERIRLSAAEKKLFDFLNDHKYLIDIWPFDRIDVHSIAPIRSRPKRTYDPLKDQETADGSEIPMTLMNLSLSNKKRWDSLKARLIAFGNSSGLFSDIVVRPLGRSSNDPFQLQFKVRGPKTNLMDVGYGVSQVLPILVRILGERQATFLLQQPEVHLHPRAQAELASLLVGIYEKNQNSFVIETHSDQMINRIRIEIMEDRIKANDISLIYLEPVGNKVKAHNIRFDDQANMIGVPKGYREFFLRESDRLFGFS